MSATSSPRVRTYGGWRRSRGIGLLGLGAGATMVVLSSAVAVLIAAAVSLKAGALLAVPAAVVITLTVARFDGIPITHLGLRRARWWYARARGWHRLRGGVLVDHPRAWDLPGVLAPTQLLEAEDGRGGTFGVVWDRRTGMLTATIRCAASSTWLVATEEADGWVSNWHQWMASLGHATLVHHVAVTVDTAPEAGATLADQVNGRIRPGAPADAVQFMKDLVARSPRAAADVDTWVSVTFDPSRAGERLETLADQTAEVSRLLDGFASSLAECGVSVLGRASAVELAAIVRTAFDPASRGEVDRIASNGDPDGMLTWADAGPVAAEESWDRYRHDSGLSVTWAWREAPRQRVTSQVLTRLLGPSRHPKRVTVLYRPLGSGDAARVLESQVNAAQFREHYRRSQGRDETARDRADREQAVQAAREEASGAGVVLLSLYATVTVEDDADLAAAAANVEAAADAAKVRLRRLYGAQAAGFACTLPVGLYPPALTGKQLR